MERPEITYALSVLLERHIHAGDPRIYWAKEVTFGYETDHTVRVDYMRFKPINNSVSGIEKGDFFCYEIKSSVEDFRSKNGHNFLGDYNYYVMPQEVYERVRTEIPYFVGVFVPNKNGYGLESVKKARRKDRSNPALEMLLMMFRSFARDEHKRDHDEMEESE